MSTATSPRFKNLQELYNAARICMPCPFGKTEKDHKVFGEGDPSALVMLIGEAPGAEEDRLKRPFVGRSGKLIDTLLHASGHVRSEVFITNVVKCRPPGNRTPLPNEITDNMKALLKEEIMLIKPKVICTLGSVATQIFFKEPIAISQVRGKPIRFINPNVVVIPTFHPAYVLRNQKAEILLSSDLKLAFELAENTQTEMSNSAL